MTLTEVAMSIINIAGVLLSIAAAIFLLALIIYIGCNGFKKPREWRDTP